MIGDEKIAMIRSVQTFVLALLVVGLFMAGTLAHAASPGKNFKRLSFTTSAATTLAANSKGNIITLRFSSKLKETPAAIQARLGGIATSAKISADGRTLTLTLDKPYRIRQFTGSDGPGIDIMGAGSASASPPEKLAENSTKPSAKTVAGAPKKSSLLSTKSKAPAPAPSSKKAKPTAEKSKPAKGISAKPSVTPSAQKTTAESKKTEPLLTTKDAAEKHAAAPLMATAETVASTKPVPPGAAQPASVTTKDSAPPPATKAAAAEKQVPAAAKPKEKAEPAPVQESEKPRTSGHDATKKLIVSARRTNAGTIINFPWRERTAAAVFERGREIWIVFSRPAEVNLPLLRTVLPKPVIEISQFQYPENTVIRIVTDGTVHAAAALTKGNYDWNVTLSTEITPAKTDVPVKADTTYATRQLILGAFDVGEPVRFYDPSIGDLLVVIPAYEEGRGVLSERNFPEFALLGSTQGITLASRQAELKTQLSRAGIAVYMEGGLKISELLPALKTGSAPVPDSITPAEVMFPYDQWYVEQKDFVKERQSRLNALANATNTSKPDSLMNLVTLYLGQGMAMEAHSYLTLIQQDFPDYYKEKKLALLHTAAYLMIGWPEEARQAIDSPELVGMEEANLWREVVMLYTPQVNTVDQIQQSAKKPEAAAIATAPVPPAAEKAGDKRPPMQLSPTPLSTTPGAVFPYLKYNRSYIRFYPPRIRQYLAHLSADAYIQNGEADKALATYDTLSRDGIIGLLNAQAQYALLLVAIEKKEIDSARDIIKRILAEPKDPFVRTRTRYTQAVLEYNEGNVSAADTAETLEKIRFSWRGDPLERKLLDSLVKLYSSTNQYAETLRAWKAILDGFPNDPDTLAISASMGELFERLYLFGLADSMTPLQSLSLFFEFRDLTPVGDRGDEIIRRLADRLAAFDLLDRATQLLEHQVKFRVSHEERSRVGARLALLHLLNNHPQEALNVLQITNYGNNPPELSRQRLQITAESLNKLGKYEEALSMIVGDTSQTGTLLRMEILWNMQDWPNVVNAAEDILTQRPNLTTPLNPQETEILLKLAIGYSFEGDNNQLRYLRDYYSTLIPDNAYKQVFDFITNDTAPLDPADVSMVAQQISNTESFLNTFRSKIAEGKLSEAVK